MDVGGEKKGVGGSDGSGEFCFCSVSQRFLRRILEKLESTDVERCRLFYKCYRFYGSFILFYLLNKF